MPRIGRESIYDLFRDRRAEYKKNLVRPLQRATEHDEPFLFESVHEAPVSFPVFLLLQGARRLPGSAMAENHCEQFLHFISEFLLRRQGGPPSE